MYNWSTLKTYMLDYHIERAEFESMPATLRILSDIYFRCQSLTANRPAQVAVQHAKNKAEALARAPSLIDIREMVDCFRNVKDNDVKQALKIASYLQSEGVGERMQWPMRHVSLAQKQDLYNEKLFEKWDEELKQSTGRKRRY